MTHQKLLEVLGSEAFRLHIIYIDDGSADRTPQLICDWANNDDRVSGILLSRNFGHQSAVTAGLQHADADMTVVMDADLQDPPGIVLELVKRWQEGFDVVNAVRRKRKENLLKRMAYASFYRIYRPLVDIDVAVDSGDFSLMDRQVVKSINELPEKNRFVRGLRSWVGFSSTEHAYERSERAAGSTKYPFSKLLGLAFDGIFNFSFKPLSFLLFSGAILFLLSLLLAALFALSRISGMALLGHSAAEVPGFTTLAIAILFFGSVQLLSVGILGEYLARIYQEVKRRPSFVVREVVGNAREQ